MREVWSNLSRNTMLILLSTTLYSNAFSSIEVGAPIEMLESVVVGQCDILLSYDEPFDSMASECELTKDNVRKAYHEISVFEIPWPRPAIPPWYHTWPTLAVLPNSDAIYCQKFARAVDGAIALYHHADIELRILHDGVSSCESVEGEIKVYPQINCMGIFSIVVGSGAIIPGVHLSFSFGNDSYCWVNGYINLEE